MNTKHTLEQMLELKLYGMAKSYETQLNQPAHQQPDGHTLVAMLAEAEAHSRVHQRTNLYLRLAKMRYLIHPEQINCSADRNLTREQLRFLSEIAFIENAENVLITGATGCGKSYLACALGNRACTLGYKTLYYSMNRFIEILATARIDGSYLKLLNLIAKTPLLILDDFGLQPIDHNTRLTLLQILEDRYKKSSMIITSQLPVKDWYEHIGDPTLADAIMDRMTAAMHKVELKGESLRKQKNV
jgi:DNA replication protein DnaC